MVNFWKSISKILTGFLATNAVFNFYFAISGNFPPPFFPGGPQLNFKTSLIAFPVDLVIVIGLLYLSFLRKGAGKVNVKDFSMILVGVFAHLILSSVPEADYLLVAIYAVFLLIFVYFGFFKKIKTIG